MEESLLLAVGVHQCDVFVGTPGHAHVTQRFRINREKTAGSAVLGRHIGNSRAVGKRQLVQA